MIRPLIRRTVNIRARVGGFIVASGSTVSSNYDVFVDIAVDGIPGTSEIIFRGSIILGELVVLGPLHVHEGLIRLGRSIGFGEAVCVGVVENGGRVSGEQPPPQCLTNPGRLGGGAPPSCPAFKVACRVIDGVSAPAALGAERLVGGASLIAEWPVGEISPCHVPTCAGALAIGPAFGRVGWLRDWDSRSIHEIYSWRGGFGCLAVGSEEAGPGGGIYTPKVATPHRKQCAELMDCARWNDLF